MLPEILKSAFDEESKITSLILDIASKAPEDKEEFRAFMHEMVDLLVDSMPSPDLDARSQLVDELSNDKHLLARTLVTEGGHIAKIDRVLGEPDSRGVKYLGVVWVPVEGKEVIKQIAWDSEFKPFKLTENTQQFIIASY